MANDIEHTCIESPVLSFEEARDVTLIPSKSEEIMEEQYPAYKTV